MIVLSKSIRSYNNPKRAIEYHTKTGFDPKRKEEMLNVTIDLLNDLVPYESNILELGAGSGLFTKMMIDTNHFKSIFITDGAEKMLEIAKKHLPSQPTHLFFDHLNFTQPFWSKKYETTKIHAVTSSMALHHAKDKKHLFEEVYKVLDSNGIFVFADHIAGTSPLVDRLIELKRARIRLHSQGEDVNDSEKMNQFIINDKKKQEAEGNKCESVSNYLNYLQGAGFIDVDCIWRDYWLAVFVAKKPDFL